MGVDETMRGPRALQGSRDQTTPHRVVAEMRRRYADSGTTTPFAVRMLDGSESRRRGGRAAGDPRRVRPGGPRRARQLRHRPRRRGLPRRPPRHRGRPRPAPRRCARSSPTGTRCSTPPSSSARSCAGRSAATTTTSSTTTRTTPTSSCPSSTAGTAPTPRASSSTRTSRSRTASPASSTTRSTRSASAREHACSTSAAAGAPSSSTAAATACTSRPSPSRRRRGRSSKAIIDDQGLPCEIRREHFFAHRPDQPYDAIVNLGVTEHLPDYARTLAAYRSLLKPGGRVYLDASAARRKNRVTTFFENQIFRGNGSPLSLQGLRRGAQPVTARARGGAQRPRQLRHHHAPAGPRTSTPPGRPSRRAGARASTACSGCTCGAASTVSPAT